MADSSLDVFFAKKDKSKKSKSRKFASVDSVAKLQEDGSKMSDKPKREKEKVSNSSGGSNVLQGPVQDDDEWKDVEEKETDYTGLKIQNVQISDLRDEEHERSKSDDLLDDEQSRNKDSLGPWNRGGVSATVEPVVEAPPPPVVEAQAPAKNETKYIAPAMRENAAASHAPSSKAKSKAAPKLTSEFDFPSLSSSSDGHATKKVDVSEVSRGKLSDSSNIRRPYAELAGKSEVTNQADS